MRMAFGLLGSMATNNYTMPLNSKLCLSHNAGYKIVIEAGSIGMLFYAGNDLAPVIKTQFFYIFLQIYL